MSLMCSYVKGDSLPNTVELEKYACKCVCVCVCGKFHTNPSIHALITS